MPTAHLKPGIHPTFRDNAEVNAKIDAYIQQNPKYWQYVQSMPRERMERAMVLTKVQQQNALGVWAAKCCATSGFSNPARSNRAA